ncbi:MAG: 4-(cytidine 5'-diphospho)-2-C-methyl-D-erythritol kinase [Methylobacteriaceae bacterium]|nr:4-(cytidine 5'-diphospho)-2-C-methyl-D-erythritol kinase [Methylobacteriaceae bacterium]
MLTARAPAKINLTLHVLGRRADGYHELESLVAFAGIGDSLSFEAGDGLTLAVSGPHADAVGASADNLVFRAARELATRVDNLQAGDFHLLKRLPVASGIGGGSSDAAAALRLLAQHNRLAIADERVIAAARATGADVPVCLDPHARMMSGIGERLGAPLMLTPLFAVLVNPGVAVETRAVFSRLGLQAGENSGAVGRSEIPASIDRAALLPLLKKWRNDLEDAACSLAPVIVDVLAVLSAAKGSRVARMSGSGATCFALFENCRQAARAARAIRRDHPSWWVKPTVLR